jgi:hypothetical protein
LLQLTNYSLIQGVKPNLALVFVLFFSYLHKEWLKRIVLVFAAAVIFKFGIAIETQNILFIISSLLGILIVEKLPASPWFSLTAATAVGTIAIGLANFDLYTVTWELTYNLLAILGVYSLFRLWQR